jgi:hopanoid biosynthesis associated RND transporter like protein HpnN
MSTPKPSLAEGVLNRMADFVYRYPRLVFYPHIILFIGCLFYTVQHLKINMNRDDLVGSDKKYHHNFLNFKKEFPGQDDLVIVVESDQTEKNRQFIERIGKRLEAETNLFADVFYRSDFKMLGSKALLFVPEPDLLELHKKLLEFRPFITNFTRATNLNTLFRQINTQFRTVNPDNTNQVQSLLGGLPALERIVAAATDSIHRPGIPPAPGISALFGGGPEAESAMYITFDRGRIYIATAHATSGELNGEAVSRLRELVQEVQREVPGVSVGVTGGPVLEIDEMEQSQFDTTLATIVSLVIVVFIFIYGYQETGRPLKATACLIIGLAFTMGYTTLVVGHLNILTITFAPMLIGLAIDFGVHLVTRYEEEIRNRKTEREAMRLAMVNTGMGIFTGCFTTAGAFFAMGVTDFKGIQEMGIISGGGLLVCLVPMMTLLPVLLLRGRQNILDHQPQGMEDRRARIERLWLERPFVVGGVTAALCIYSVSQFKKVYFDYNLLHMQSEGMPAVVFEQKLINSASNSVLFGAVVADTLPQALELERRLTNLPTVAMVRSMSHFLGENQEDKLVLVRKIKAEIQDIRFEEEDKAPPDLAELSRTIYSTQGYIGNALEVVHKEGQTNLAAGLKQLWDGFGDLRHDMLNVDPGQAMLKLGAFQRAFLGDLQDTFNILRNQDVSGGLKTEDLPGPLRNRFIGKSGKLLIQVYPKGDVWQRGPQERFVKELRTVDPNVTGEPVQLYEYESLLKDSYVDAAYKALYAIAILVFIHFRSVLCVLLSLLPVAIGAIWMVGFMAVAGIPFNPANIMTLPLVVGIGVTNGIHILNRFAEEQSPSILARSTGKAVLVSGLTTIAGFGSLIIAKHNGIRSLGCIMAVGTATCMIAGLTFLPVLLNILTRRGWKLKRPSGNNALLPLGREEPKQI